MLKKILSGLTLAGLVATMVGAVAAPSMALPIMHPQTTQQLAYWHHHRHWHHHHNSGLHVDLHL